MKHYVYKITDPITEDYYIGVRTCKGKPENDPYMGSYCSWEPEDETRLVKEILKDDFENRKEANEYERTLQIQALKEKKDPKCMNAYITDIGFCNYGKKHRDESKEKMSKIVKKRFKNPKNHPMYGKSFTEERKQKIREAKLGKSRSEETKYKISKSLMGDRNPKYWKGKRHSEETIQKISNSLKGRYSGEDNPFYGKTHSEETIQKISEANKGENHPFYGKTHSEETIQKISEANKGENHPNSKKVKQFTKDGKFIKEWDYIQQAVNELGISSISACCRGRLKTSGGFIWKYSE